MPIRPENLHRYPPDWPQIRARILVRAGNRCERCHVANGHRGGRLRDGTFCNAVPEQDMLRLKWPAPGTVAWCALPDRSTWVKLRIIRIVLTIAHLNHVVEDCSDSNLRALCQRCHLAHDAKHHAETRYNTQRIGRASGDLFDGAAG